MTINQIFILNFVMLCILQSIIYPLNVKKIKKRCKTLDIKLKNTSWGRGTTLWRETEKAINETNDQELKKSLLYIRIFQWYGVVSFVLAAIALFTSKGSILPESLNDFLEKYFV